MKEEEEIKESHSKKGVRFSIKDIDHKSHIDNHNLIEGIPVELLKIERNTQLSKTTYQMAEYQQIKSQEDLVSLNHLKVS